MKRLFMIDSPVNNFLSTIVDTFMLNTLFILFSLPLVTIGAAATALHSVNNKIICGKKPYIIQTFVKSFRKNFKVSTLIWLLMIIWIIILVLNYQILRYSSGLLYFLSLSALFIFFILTILVASIIFVYIGKFDNTLKGYVFSSVQLLLINPHYMVTLVGLSVVPWIIIFSTTQTLLTGIYFLTFGGFSLLSLLKNKITEKLFKKYH